MNKPALLLSLSLLLCSIPLALADEEAQSEYFQQITALQHRAEKLVSNGLDSNNYHLAKARTWLDLALSEAYDNDTGGIVPAAIAQAATSLDALEKKQAVISMDTPTQISGSESVRPDLWDKIAALKKHGKFSCAQRPIAEAEVYLVWIGHEKYESGWSHAESYVNGAEDRIYAAKVAIDNCTPPAVKLAQPPPPLEKITLSGDAMFAFNSATLIPSALWRLDKLADDILSAGQLEEILLVGHTDNISSKGYPKHNQIISEQRAENIKEYLIGKNIPAEKIHASGAGSTQPLVKCSTKLKRAKLVACLQPNRRVEIILHGVKTTGANKGPVK